jgi:hypothetical protein
MLPQLGELLQKNSCSNCWPYCSYNEVAAMLSTAVAEWEVKRREMIGDVMLDSKWRRIMLMDMHWVVSVGECSQLQ